MRAISYSIPTIGLSLEKYRNKTMHSEKYRGKIFHYRKISRQDFWYIKNLATRFFKNTDIYCKTENLVTRFFNIWKISWQDFSFWKISIREGPPFRNRPTPIKGFFVVVFLCVCFGASAIPHTSGQEYTSGSLHFERQRKENSPSSETGLASSGDFFSCVFRVPLAPPGAFSFRCFQNVWESLVISWLDV